MTPTEEARETLARIWAKHRPISRNGGSGCSCGEDNPGLTITLNTWHEVHLRHAILDVFQLPEWEYGSISPWRDDNYMMTSKRTPDNWYGAERPIYRRRFGLTPGEWEVYDGPITMELAHRPWLRPGGDPKTHPAYNRSPHRETPEWTFAPDSGYEQDIAKYNFRYARCGRTQEHFPHSKLDGTEYCDGRVTFDG